MGVDADSVDLVENMDMEVNKPRGYDQTRSVKSFLGSLPLQRRSYLGNFPFADRQVCFFEILLQRVKDLSVFDQEVLGHKNRILSMGKIFMAEVMGLTFEPGRLPRRWL